MLPGKNQTLIIDDTYNSSPFACESALRTLAGVAMKGRKIAVLGDMLELGKHTEDAHKRIGAVVKETSDALVVVGPRSAFTKEGAIMAGMDPERIFEFKDSQEAGEFLETFIVPGDVVLIKGSQGMRMERAVGAVLFDQIHKHVLLVRQDREWLSKK
jgi:UDP-N-acetylmuramoyl-tripeptide--D-alanyl-D-alanine ligase